MYYHKFFVKLIWLSLFLFNQSSINAAGCSFSSPSQKNYFYFTGETIPTIELRVSCNSYDVRRGFNWSVSPPLPAGLVLGNFDKGTAKITGTPTQAVTNYQVTVKADKAQASGSTTINLTFTITNNPTHDFWHPNPCTTATGPSPRGFAAMGSNLNKQQALLFGGLGEGITILGDTWRYTSGSGWSSLSPSPTPNARYGACMACQRDLNNTNGPYVLFGGVLNASGSISDETWVFSNDKWIPVTAEARTNSKNGYPPARAYAAMAYNSKIQRCVMFGGTTGTSQSTGSLLSDTWVFNAATYEWTQVFPANSPTPRYRSAMDSIASAQNTYLFGGSTTLPDSFTGLEVSTNETWQLSFEGVGTPTDVNLISKVIPLQGAKSKHCLVKVVNKLTWKPPVDHKGIVAYEIYSDSDLQHRIAVIPAKKRPLKFMQRANPCKRYTYFIVSKDASGERSTSVSASIHEKKLCKKIKKCLKKEESSSSSSS